ncbi:unnamed protein product [Gordionus sp. m RMFG-2023]
MYIIASSAIVKIVRLPITTHTRQLLSSDPYLSPRLNGWFNKFGSNTSTSVLLSTSVASLSLFTPLPSLPEDSAQRELRFYSEKGNKCSNYLQPRCCSPRQCQPNKFHWIFHLLHFSRILKKNIEQA